MSLQTVFTAAVLAISPSSKSRYSATGASDFTISALHPQYQQSFAQNGTWM